MKEDFDIPLLNNISDALSIVNGELQSYFDLLHDDNIHYPYSIKHVVINLSTCMELLIKFRLLEEHWALKNIGRFCLMILIRQKTAISILEIL